MLLFLDKASKPVRHIAATLFTLVSVAGIWFLTWTFICLLLTFLFAEISASTYFLGLSIVFIGLLPSLLIVIPAVLWAERITEPTGVLRYLAQIPIVFGIVIVTSISMLIFGALMSWLLIPGFLGYIGLPAIMALPIAGIYWIICKWIEFGLDSIRELLSLIVSGFRGAIDLFQLIRHGKVVPKNTVHPIAVTQASADTPHNTPSPDPATRGR